VKNFYLGSKLVSVAAAALVLAVVLLPSATIFAQSSPVAPKELAASTPASSVFDRRATMPGGVQQEQRLSAGPIIGLICAIVASSVALGVAFGLRRQIDRIAGPDPEKIDDD
jgi:hypothetical protein